MIDIHDPHEQQYQVMTDTDDPRGFQTGHNICNSSRGRRCRMVLQKGTRNSHLSRRRYYWPPVCKDAHLYPDCGDY
ncbi:hypothetical protein B0H19DRAFT_1122815, partial [Mycena capillaripes]